MASNGLKGKQRIQVTVSDEFYGLITDMAKKIGVTNSQFCSMVLGQALYGVDMGFKKLDSKMDKALTDSNGE